MKLYLNCFKASLPWNVYLLQCVKLRLFTISLYRFLVTHIDAFYIQALYRCWLIIRCFLIVLLQSQTLTQKTRVWLRKTIVIVFVRQTWMCLLAEIRAWSSVSSLWCLSVHLDLRVSLIAGMEYGMERWNGKWNGTVNVHSYSWCCPSRLS